MQRANWGAYDVRNAKDTQEIMLSQRWSAGTCCHDGAQSGAADVGSDLSGASLAVPGARVTGCAVAAADISGDAVLTMPGVLMIARWPQVCRGCLDKEACIFPGTLYM